MQELTHAVNRLGKAPKRERALRSPQSGVSGEQKAQILVSGADTGTVDRWHLLPFSAAFFPLWPRDGGDGTLRRGVNS